MDWRARLSGSASEIREASAEDMATRRIMRCIGSNVQEIGGLCSRFGIPYVEEESRFSRAVKILREVYQDIDLIDYIDVKTGKSATDVKESMLDGDNTGIVFFRPDGADGMTAFIVGPGLSSGPLAPVILQPGIRYVEKNGIMELWEQEPSLLLKSFSLKSRGL